MLDSGVHVLSVDVALAGLPACAMSMTGPASAAGPREGFFYRDPREGGSRMPTAGADQGARDAAGMDRGLDLPLANGHIQATGRDARGRKQYRYHAASRGAG